MRYRFHHPVDFKARVILAPYSREMRLAPTTSETLLWSAIRCSALGVRFRRQVVLGHFIVDFFAPSVSLVIEVDGPVQDAQIDEDRRRDAALAARGLRLLRISALLIESNLTAAVARIREAIEMLRGAAQGRARLFERRGQLREKAQWLSGRSLDRIGPRDALER